MAAGVADDQEKQHPQAGVNHQREPAAAQRLKQG
jgi:hypothetical protein